MKKFKYSLSYVAIIILIPILVFLINEFLYNNLLYPLFGLALFEYAWKFTARHRNIDEERDKRFPAWRRNDAPKWNKLTLYLGAVTFLPLRMFGFTFSTALYVGALKILYFGHDFNKPIPPNKRRIGKKLYQISSFFNAFWVFV